MPITMDLSGDWAFAYRPEAMPNEAAGLPAAEFQALMPVPGNWDDHYDRLRSTPAWSKARFNPNYRPLEFPMGTHPPDATLPFLLGTGWYRRQLALPEIDRHARIVLTVGGAVSEAWVWLNGRCLAHHTTHRLPFAVRLDPWARAGANDLTIAVSNTRQTKPACDLRGFAGYSAGICGPVTLKISRYAALQDLYLRPVSDGRKIAWQVDAAGDAIPRGARLHYRLSDPRSGRAAIEGDMAARSGLNQWMTSAQGVEFWSDRNPCRYQMHCELRHGTEMFDQVEQTAGLRMFQRRGTQLLLNGQPLYLRGMCEHGYFPLTTTPPLDAAFYLENCRKLKELGYNWIRFHTWAPSAVYLDAADEAGLLVQVEAYTGFDATDWRRILRHCRAHPSVILYSCGNEECIDAQRLALLRRMAGVMRREAPDALFNPQSALRGVEYGQPSHLGRGAVERPYPHHPGKLARLKKFADVFAPYCWGMLSYTTSIARGGWREIDRRLKAYRRPCLGHEIGITGTYLDLDLEGRYRGSRIGPGLYAAARRYLARSGLLGNAALYYRNSCALARQLYKHNLETARLCRTLSGYDHLGAYDHHWHRYGYPCGVMNEFYELKPGESAERFRQANGESVLILEAGYRRNYQAGADAAWDLHVSWFAPERTSAGRVDWRLTDHDGAVQARGELPAGKLAPGLIRRLGRISLRMPRVDQAARFTLHVRLAAPRREITNQWDFWVFPDIGRAGRPAEASLAGALRERWGGRFPGWLRAGREAPVIIPSLTDADWVRLREGAAMILLGHQPFPALPTEFHSCTAGRARGNMATVIHDHPLTRGFPHAGWCDWPFYFMLEQGAAVVFDGLPLEFKPIVEVVSSFKLIVKQAALFECRVGLGRLLVCPMNLRPDDPAGVDWLQRMAAYAAGPDFHPGFALDLERFARLPPVAELDGNYAATDQAWDAALEERPAHLPAKPKP